MKFGSQNCQPKAWFESATIVLYMLLRIDQSPFQPSAKISDLINFGCTKLIRSEIFAVIKHEQCGKVQKIHCYEIVILTDS